MKKKEKERKKENLSLEGNLRCIKYRNGYPCKILVLFDKSLWIVHYNLFFASLFFFASAVPNRFLEFFLCNDMTRILLFIEDSKNNSFQSENNRVTTIRDEIIFSFLV